MSLLKRFIQSDTPPDRRELGRIVLFVFFATYLLTRLAIAFDMLHHGPKIYLSDDHTHVHHFVYGICLLSIVGGYLIFGQPSAFKKRVAAFFYAIGLVLAFDEFGMWLKLKDLYWERDSYEVISIITGALAFIAFFPKPKPTGLRPWRKISALGCACFLLSLSLIYVFGLLRDHYSQALRMAERIGQETSAPPPSGAGGQTQPVPPRGP